MQVLDGRRESCGAKSNSSNCLLQLLLFVFAFAVLCGVVQSQTAVTAYLKSKQLLLFVFAIAGWFGAKASSSNCLLFN